MRAPTTEPSVAGNPPQSKPPAAAPVVPEQVKTFRWEIVQLSGSVAGAACTSVERCAGGTWPVEKLGAVLARADWQVGRWAEAEGSANRRGSFSLFVWAKRAQPILVYHLTSPALRGGGK